MIESLLRCPICRERMTADLRMGTVDCPRLHHATTDAAVWQDAHIRMIIEDVDSWLRPGDEVTDHAHRWLTVERTRGETLEECLTCAGWRMVPAKTDTPACQAPTPCPEQTTVRADMPDGASPRTAEALRSSREGASCLVRLVGDRVDVESQSHGEVGNLREELRAQPYTTLPVRGRHEAQPGHPVTSG